MTDLQVSSARNVVRRDAGASQEPRDAARGACKSAPQCDLRVAHSGLSASSSSLDDVPHRLHNASYPKDPTGRSDVSSYSDREY